MASQKHGRTNLSRSRRGGRRWWPARAVSATLTRLGDALLGPVARAARIVADADARLVGIDKTPFPPNFRCRCVNKRPRWCDH